MSPHRLPTHTALVGACATAGLALAGCGGAPSDRAAIGATFTTVAHGLLDGDGHAVCEHVTQETIDSIASAGVLGGTGARCPDAIAALAQDLGPRKRDALRHARLRNLTILGDRATGTDNIDGSPDRFERIDGRWYLSDPMN